MIYFVLFVLSVSILLYLVMAGADFGGGLLELVKGRQMGDRQRKLIDNAMGPVWEANHIWLVLVIVIIFVGFPRALKDLSIYLHIPVTALLIGIIFRGCAFTFRHYDAVKDSSQKIYSWVFTLSSLWCSLWIGIIGGSVVLGQFPLVEEGSDFFAVFVAPWANGFSLAVGLLTCCLFAYLAATFLATEAEEDDLKELFASRSSAALVGAMLFGGAVFGLGYILAPQLIDRFISNQLFVVFFASSAICTVWQQVLIRQRHYDLLKYLSVLQVVLVLAGLAAVQAPYVYTNPTLGHSLTLFEAAAPASTLKQLCIALAVGVVLIFPPYIYLMRTFKGGKD